MMRKPIATAIWILFAVSFTAFVGYTILHSMRQDTSGPVITVSEALLPVSVEDAQETYLKGVIASDPKDGDVSNTLVVESVSGFTENHEREVHLAAFDSDQHTGRAVRKIVYTDYQRPSFYLNAPLRVPTSTQKVAVRNLFRVWDCLDGNISGKVVFAEEGNLAMNTPGDYPVTVEVTNSAGDKRSLTATLTVFDPQTENSAPKLYLTEYVVYLSVGEELSPEDYFSHMDMSGVRYYPTEGEGTFRVDTSYMTDAERRLFNAQQPQISMSRIRIDNPVKNTEPGIYEILYTVDDGYENVGQVRLIVVVEEDA